MKKCFITSGPGHYSDVNEHFMLKQTWNFNYQNLFEVEI